MKLETMTMPMSSGGSEDFYSTDEVKVYNDEGNRDEEKISSENLNEEKLGLVTESEEVSARLSSNKCRAFDLFLRSWSIVAGLQY